MKLFRICTENTNRAAVEQLAKEYFDAFTLIDGKGFWRGIPESALVIEVMLEASYAGRVRRFAEKLRALNDQECVLVQTIELEAEFV